MPVAVVTGSSSGIGRQTAIEFAGLGYAVVLHARHNLRGLQHVADELRSLGVADVRCITADISSPAASRDLVSAAFAWQGVVDVWVNNAGADVLTKRASRWSFDEKLQQLLMTDVAGTIRISRDVVARMQAYSQSDLTALPSIINMGWDQAWLGMEGTPGQLFCSSKAAVMAFSQALGLSCGPRVRVNCVAPGWIKTAWGEQAASEYWERRAREECTLGRWGNPVDVARAIVWLAGPASEFVNGQIISVNGGRRFWADPS